MASSQVERIRLQTTDTQLHKLLKSNPLGHKDATLRADIAKFRLLSRAAVTAKATVARTMLCPINRIASVTKSPQQTYTPLEFKQMLEAMLSLIKHGALDGLPEPQRSQYVSAWRMSYSNARRAYVEAPKKEPLSETPEQTHAVRALHDALSKLAPGHRDRLMVKLMLHIGDLSPNLLAQLPGCMVQATEDPDSDSNRPKAECVLLLNKVVGEPSFLLFTDAAGSPKRRLLTEDIAEEVCISLQLQKRELLFGKSYKDVASNRKHLNDFLKRLDLPMTYKHMCQLACSSQAKTLFAQLVDKARELDVADSNQTPMVMVGG